MTGCGGQNGDRNDDRNRLDPLFDDLAARLGIPVGAGLPSGHCRPNFTLPFGMPAEIDFDGAPGMLRVREAAVL
jgi:muramoyltetrapeptide carboxypeptidase LdcA involved in peptidoglycan recycling